MPVKPVLYGATGCGSAVVEATFTLLGESYDYVEAEPWTPSPAVDALRALNPLVQIPTLRLPDGTVMTESVAILLWLLERHPGALAPAPGDPLRPTFLRWLVYLPAAIYPMYTVGDFCDRWVPGADAQAALKQATIDRTLECWRGMEAALQPQPDAWILGTADWTVLDLYICMMTRWRPRGDAIAAVAPGIAAVARKVEADPRLAAFWQRHFGEGYDDP